jgi:hypothetical protein
LKKIAAISILGILLFNWCGYRWVIDFMQQRADTRLEARLDRNDYDESRLVEIRIPLNMPYQSNWSGFERYNGEVEYNGIHYKFVKRKIENGQLVLKCIPNDTRQRLQTARDDFFKLVNDLQQEHSSQKSGNTHIVKNNLGDYDDHTMQISVAMYCPALKDYAIFHVPRVNANFHLAIEQPPEC